MKIALIGDSTVTDTSGWGKAFADRFGGEVTVVNFSVGGRSSRSWHDEQRLPPVLAEKPDYVLIQFGHNDQPGKGPDRETDPATSYRDYLRLYVDEFRKAGARPILLSSVVRRIFDETGKIKSTLGPWAEAARAVAAERNVPFIDLHTASMQLHNGMGAEASMTFNLVEGDTSHFNRRGAEAIADLVVAGLREVAAELAGCLKLAAHDPPQRQSQPAMRRGNLETGTETEHVTNRESNAVQWFGEARFGLFVHWGLYSIPAGVWKGVRSGRNWYAEWIQMQGNWPHGIPADEYRALLSRFNPVRFDADAWMSEAANAGMRYLMFTTKHHDGFALWPSRVSRFNVVEATPFKRDVVGELVAACRRRGLRVGFYYSHWQDWEHPGGARPKEENPAEPTLLRRQPSQEAFERYWTEKCLPQVAELIEDYRPDLFWFDNWRAAEHLTPERLDRLIALVRERAPDCLINSRIGTTWNHPRGDDMVDYLSMQDNQFPEETIARPWETSGTMNRSWGCHQLDFAWKSSGQLIRHLVDNASRGGNFQLNIGPLGDGSLPPPAVRRLREIGAWLTVNGEGVYGTQAGGLPTPDWGRITRRTLPDGRERLYLHVYDWRGGQDLPALPLPAGDAVCRVLETGQEVATRRTADGIVVTLPEERADERVTVLTLDATPREGGAEA